MPKDPVQLPKCGRSCDAGTIIATGGPQVGQPISCGGCQGTGYERPVFAFQELLLEAEAEAHSGEISYWPDEFTDFALGVAERSGWLASAVEAPTRKKLEHALEGLRDLGLDETDTFHFAVLWELEAAGSLRPVPGLREDLLDWRSWEEAEHVGERFDFLTDLSAEPTAPPSAPPPDAAGPR